MKNWVTVAIAIIALVASVCALYLDNEHLELQRTQHEEAIKLGRSALGADTQHHQEALEADIQHHQEAMELGRSALEADTQHYEELSDQYEEVIRPHTKHEEIYDDISLLYDLLVLCRDWLSTLPYEDRKVPEPYYIEANNNFYSAIKELRVKNFHEAERLVGDAYASLAEGYKAYASVVSSNTTASE